jgi:hypothetical protein
VRDVAHHSNVPARLKAGSLAIIVTNWVAGPGPLLQKRIRSPDVSHVLFLIQGVARAGQQSPAFLWRQE